MELRVLIHAPRGRDASVVKDVVQPHHRGEICNTSAQLIAAMKEGAAAAVITEEVLGDAVFVQTLQEWLYSQQPWSDFPFIVLASRQAGPRPSVAVSTL